MPAYKFDMVVLGGGLLGASIALGLVRNGVRVAIIDEGDVADRASRGNFALVWVQGKGWGNSAYAAWTIRSALAWPDFSAELKDETGIDVGYSRPGGFHLTLSDDEFEQRRRSLAALHSQEGMPAYKTEIIDGDEVRRRLPYAGPDVTGGSFCMLDGHVNSLRLFRALHTAFARNGGKYIPRCRVENIIPSRNDFQLQTALGQIGAERVVLTAGLDNERLAPFVGLEAPIRAVRGQIIVTEKTEPFLENPFSTLRQTDEGSVMIGDSHENVASSAEVKTGILASMADRARRMFPHLGQLNVVRSWSALRVMIKDGFPIYDQSCAHPGAFIATCHSGVTLAAAHAQIVAPQIACGKFDPILSPFSASRFHV